MVTMILEAVYAVLVIAALVWLLFFSLGRKKPARAKVISVKSADSFHWDHDSYSR